MTKSNELEKSKWIKEPVKEEDFHVALTLGSKAKVSKDVRNAIENLLELLHKEELAKLSKSKSGVKLTGTMYMDSNHQ